MLISLVMPCVSVVPLDIILHCAILCCCQNHVICIVVFILLYLHYVCLCFLPYAYDPWIFIISSRPFSTCKPYRFFLSFKFWLSCQVTFLVPPLMFIYFLIVILHALYVSVKFHPFWSCFGRVQKWSKFEFNSNLIYFSTSENCQVNLF